MSKTVLIVDDDPNLIQAISLRCRELGLSVQSSSESKQALRKMLSELPDLAIFDINMPGTDGLFVGEMLAQDPQLATVPIIFLTGRSDDHTIRHCKEIGARYVHKGADAWNQLKPILCQLLDLSLKERT
ncbi:MAG: response regulator [Phycisphaerales bacterium]|nr:response regulator [Phycisphaerales bacterium]